VQFQTKSQIITAKKEIDKNLDVKEATVGRKMKNSNKNYSANNLLI
jgi:hypothetical protein